MNKYNTFITYSSLLKIRARIIRVVCVRIFGESPDFLEKSCFEESQKSGFFGKVLFLEKVKVRIFRKNVIFFKNSKLRISERTESSGFFEWTFG